MKFLLAKLGFTVLFTALLGSFLEMDILIAFAAVATLIGVIIKILFKEKGDFSLIFISIAIGFALVAINLVIRIYPEKQLDTVTAEITGVVTEISNSGGNPTYTVKTESIDIKGAPQKIKLKISGWEESLAMPYDKISCSVSFAVYKKEELSSALENRSNGYSVFGYAGEKIEVIGEKHNSLGYYIFRVREEISSAIYRYFIDWQAPFMDELLIGRKGELDSSITMAFRKSGLSHIIAISGTHLVVIIGLLEKLLSYSKKRSHQRTKAIILIFATAFYILVGGMGMSVLRSGIMLILSYGIKAFFGGSKPMDNLGVAVMAILLFDPFASNDIGFLMSVFSFASISLFSEKMKNLLLKPFKNHKKLIEFIMEGFATSIVASVSVIPISLLVFGNITLVAPISNIFATLFAQYMLTFGVATVIFAFIPLCSFFAKGCAFVTMLCGGVLYKVAQIFSKVPFGNIYSENESLIVWLFATLALLFIPLVFKRKRFLKLSLAISAVALLSYMLLHSIFYSETAKITVTALEEGTAISIEHREGSFIFTNGLTYADRYRILNKNGYDVILSTNAKNGYAETELLDTCEPKFALVSNEDAVLRCEKAHMTKSGIIDISDRVRFQIIDDGIFTAKSGEFNLLYISKECDIIDLESEYLKSEIIIFDGVSPQSYPFLRCDYLILRNKSGYYSGASEVITLESGEAVFYAYEENVTKGRHSN